tara:strand:- start:22 stop:141 length:120 start_codon:yes stop_codon:yes gene_type:complete
MGFMPVKIFPENYSILLVADLIIGISILQTSLKGLIINK